MNHSKNEIRDELTKKISRYFAVTPGEATKNQMFRATALTVRDMLSTAENGFREYVKKEKAKIVHYICMEFLLGPSLKNHLYNLGLTETYREVLAEMGFSLDEICETELDPGLGNGGLGRLAACYMDSLATLGYPAKGYSICYEYGLFKQKILEGEQLELPDIWLPNGEVWLIPGKTRR